MTEKRPRGLGVYFGDVVESKLRAAQYAAAKELGVDPSQLEEDARALSAALGFYNTNRINIYEEEVRISLEGMEGGVDEALLKKTLRIFGL